MASYAIIGQDEPSDQARYGSGTRGLWKTEYNYRILPTQESSFLMHDHLGHYYRCNL